MAELFSDGLTALHPDRLISSVYFDSYDNRAFTESEEGVVPRKKIRIRSYPKVDESAWFEIKISSVEGRFKTSERITAEKENLLLIDGFFDPLYGEVFPRVFVHYTRSYFSYRGVRITYDRNILYKSVINLFEKREDFEVFEVKAPAGIDLDYIINLFPYRTNRFSKFCNAMAFFYKI